MTADLIATLEGLTQPSREADALISKTLLNYADVERDGPAGWKKVPDYTASLDAAIALVERVLPGLHRNMMHHPDGESFAGLSVPGGEEVGIAFHRSSEAIALLIALLRAKEAKDGN
jgi:hypothetical protein